MSKIYQITSLREGINQEQLREATKNFLKPILSAENVIEQHDVELKVMQQYGGKGYKLTTLTDQSKWVEGDKGIERLIGSYYLNKQLLTLAPDLEKKWEAVETKYIIKSYKKEIKITFDYNGPLKNIPVIKSDDLIPYSRYVGDKKPDPSLISVILDKRCISKNTGFSDFAQDANIRIKEDGTRVIIDTEYGSFVSNAQPLRDDVVNLSGQEFTFNISEFNG